MLSFCEIHVVTFGVMETSAVSYTSKDFYHMMLCRLQSAVLLQIVHPSVCPSFCPSEALRCRGHIGCITSKIISWLISRGFLLSADPKITSPKGAPHNFGQNKGRVDFS